MNFSTYPEKSQIANNKHVKIAFTQHFLSTADIIATKINLARRINHNFLHYGQKKTSIQRKKCINNMYSL